MSGRLTDQQRRDRDLSEDELRSMADEVAVILGYEHLFVKPLRAAGGIWKTPTYGSLGKGWVDSLYVHPVRQRLVFCEFKKELGKTTPDQERVHSVLRSAGCVVLVIRPSSLDRLIEVLNG